MPIEDPLIINGVAVDRALLEARPWRRCELVECQAHCCGGGVAINVTQAEDILAHKDLILPHLPPDADRRDFETWFVGPLEPEHDHPAGGMLTNTRVIPDPTHPAGTTCIFLRPDRKCALQAAGIAAGEHPWRFKPLYCAMHPVTFVRRVVRLDDDNPLYTAGGDCQRPAPEAPIPVYQLFEAEVKLALGEAGYGALGEMANPKPVVSGAYAEPSSPPNPNS